MLLPVKERSLSFLPLVRYSENGRSISVRSRWHAPRESGPLVIFGRDIWSVSSSSLSVGFRSFQCVLVTVGINRLLMDGPTESALTRPLPASVDARCPLKLFLSLGISLPSVHVRPIGGREKRCFWVRVDGELICHPKRGRRERKEDRMPCQGPCTYDVCLNFRHFGSPPPCQHQIQTTSLT